MRNEKNSSHVGLKFGSAYFLLFAVYGICTPYLQIILRRLGYSSFLIGILLGLFELAGIAGPIFLARKADTVGRSKPFLYASAVSICLGFGMLVGIPHPVFTVLGISLLSLGLKTPIPVLDAMILHSIEYLAAKGAKAPTYGVLRGLASLGYVLVTLGLQIIPGFDSSPPWVMALGSIGIAALFALGLIPVPETGTGHTEKHKTPFSLRWVDSVFIAGLGVIGLGRLAMASLNSFLALYLTEYLQWNAVGGIYALSAVVEIPVMLVAWRFMRAYSPMHAVGISSAAIVVRLLLMAIFPTRGTVVIAQFLHSLCYGLFLPAAVAFVNMKTPPAERTTGMALLLGVGMGLPAVLGSALGGVVVQALGFRWLFGLFSLFAAASVILFLSCKKSLVEVR